MGWPLEGNMRHVKSTSCLDNLCLSTYSSEDYPRSSGTNLKIRNKESNEEGRCRSSGGTALRVRSSSIDRDSFGKETEKSEPSKEFPRAESHSKTDIRDVLNVIKFSYIMQESPLKDCDLSSVPKVVNDLWTELKDGLKDRRIFEECSKSVRHNSQDCVCHRSKNDCLDAKESEKETFGTRHTSKDCALTGDIRDIIGELVEDGLLDSIIAYIAPHNQSGKKAPFGSLSENNASSSSSEDGRRVSGRKKVSKADSSDLPSPSDAEGNEGRSKESLSGAVEMVKSREVTIHVCDEVRNTQKDFTCPQDLLLSQMGYFRDVTSGQSLEDVDISVHCDVSIFEWLILWIREDQKPEFEPENVISILVSAEFLKMSPLVESAVHYVHRNMNKILCITQNFACVGDPLLTKLSEMYKPSEVEMILDRKDRIQSRLYSKMIVSLCDSLPQPEREILETASTLHRCRICGFYLTKNSAKFLPCHPFRSTIDSKGFIVPTHKRDPNFNINEFLKALRLELKSWRKVFWRLWGMVHILYCSLCSVYFPVYLHEFCSYHPQDPEFSNIQFKNSTQPFGQYPCCKVDIFRFQPLPPLSQGCQAREHRVKIRADTDKKTYRLLLAHRDVICLIPNRKGGIKISSADAHSITLPSINSKSMLSNCQRNVEDVARVVCRKGFIDRSVWETSSATKSSKGQGSRSTTANPIRRNPSSTNFFSNNVLSDPNLSSKDSSKPAYGRLKREPKLPPKKFYQSSSSSSITDEGSEDGASSLGEDDFSDEPATASTSNDVCTVEIKSGKNAKKLTDGQRLGEMGILGSKGVTFTIGGTNIANQSFSSNATLDMSVDKESSTSSWISDRSTRANQDQQREDEESSVREISKYLCGKRKQRLPTSSGTGHSKSATTENIFGRTWPSAGLLSQLGNTFGGSFLKLEQDWRETHMAYLQHRSSSASHQGGRNRPGSALGARTVSKMRISRSLANLQV